MTGKAWVGMGSVPKPQPGQTIVEAKSFTSRCDDVETIVQITTQAGLSAWIDPVASFDARRGGDISFEPGYGGSYALVQIPRHVVLLTERHGEISIRVNTKSKPIAVEVTITRFVPETEDVSDVRALLQSTITALQERLNVTP